MIVNLIDMLNPKGGRGVSETIIALVFIVGLFVLNYSGVTVDKTIEYIAVLFFGYMWGNRPTKKEGVETNENENA